MALRIPGWCSSYHIKGLGTAETKEQDGYLYITKVWQSDCLELEFPMKVQILDADGRVREDIGKAAVMRGPVVYCLEEADNGQELHLLKMDENAVFEIEQGEMQVWTRI